ncbi:MAG: hypothetical protein PHO63_00460 [Bacilli bacterium]|nr:hypothetical protein [Bacilli bacterium]
MVLKKPYAFLIKRFKLLHLILLFFMLFLTYKTNNIINFLTEYLASTQLITKQDFASELFNIYMYIVPFLIIIFSMIILSVMYIKKKPLVFYIANIAIYLGLLIIYNFSHSIITTFQFELVDARTIRLVRDFLFLIFALQCFSIVITFIRATGFDIKKFDFGHDLQELEITVEDNEEFEFSVSVDANKLKRGVRRNFRFSKYVYLENKFLINIISLIAISIICFVAYLNLGVYNKLYDQGVTFPTNNFIITVKNTYLTNQDYKLKEISEDKYLVVLELEIRSKFFGKNKLVTANAELLIGNEIYYHNNKFRSMLLDLGVVYQNTIIPTEFTKVLLVYEIPKEAIKKPMILKFIDKVDGNYDKLSPKYISTKLKPFNFDENRKIVTAKLGEIITFNNEVLKESTLKIDRFEIAKKFKIDYNFCVKKDDCFESTEFVHPKLNTNYDKALLKIVGNLTIDEDANVSGLYDLYNLVDYFGTISYEFGGKIKVQKIGLNEIRPQKVKQTNTYYVEIAEEIGRAQNIILQFNIRNRTYKYAIDMMKQQ